MRKTIILLVGIFLLACVLRFYRLGSVPVGLHRDEAFLGYNAFSLLKTGRDMTGNVLPIHLESFLYSPAGYSYASIPFIALFGLSAFSVRFASALFGSLTIIVTFFLTQELFKKSLISYHVSLIASFFLAISPWHIILSRTATENTLVVFFVALGVLLWLRGFLFASLISFFVTLGIYQAPRVFLLLFLPFLFILFGQAKKKKLLSWSMFVVLIMLPLVVILLSPTLSLRIRTVSIFAHAETQLTIDESIREDGGKNPLTRVYHNKLIAYSGQVIQNYFDHFSYRFLFTEHVLPMRYRIAGTGLLYLFELPILIFGMWKLFSDNRRAGMLLVLWVLLAPVGSALTFDDIPNLQRTLIIFPALSIISAYGVWSLATHFSSYRRMFFVILAIIIAGSLSFYLHQYYQHGVVHRPWFRQEGYAALVSKVNALLPSYRKAIITNRETAPTIFFLFYESFDPIRFQQIARESALRDFDRVGFGNYEFSQEECPLRDIRTKEGAATTTGEKGVLYVNSGFCKDMTYGTLRDEIKRPDNSTVFKLYDFP